MMTNVNFLMKGCMRGCEESSVICEDLRIEARTVYPASSARMRVWIPMYPETPVIWDF
jgi:hypothetical protein